MHHIPSALGFVFHYQITTARAPPLFRCLFQRDPISAFTTSKEGGVVWVTPLWLSCGLLPRLKLKHSAPWTATSAKPVQKEHQKPSQKPGSWGQRSSFLTTDRSSELEATQYLQYRSFLRPVTCTTFAIRGLHTTGTVGALLAVLSALA